MKAKVISTKTTGFTSSTYRIPAASAGHVVEYWYDKRSRSWIVQYKDGDDNQVGTADYVGTKDDAIIAAAHMSKKTAQEMVN